VAEVCRTRNIKTLRRCAWDYKTWHWHNLSVK